MLFYSQSGAISRKLAGLNLWITGQRKDQSITRQDVRLIEEDSTFSTPENRLLKLNPLANWTSKNIWRYIAEHNVPFNPLHESGYKSIGCQPCTRPVLPVNMNVKADGGGKRKARKSVAYINTSQNKLQCWRIIVSKDKRSLLLTSSIREN